MIVRSVLSFAAIAVLIPTLLVLPWASAEEATKDLVPLKQMSLELANELAWNALKACRKVDFQVAVAVVDRGGRTQVLLRDYLAGPHTIAGSQGKALTALSFRVPTSRLAEETAPGTPASGLRSLEGLVMVGGGLVVESRGQIVGAIGVSGAAGPANDEACAKAGIDSVIDRLTF